ncbi:MAG: LysR substrate-binding domain-containing protein, partial [Pseudomonadota bacterium]
EKSVGVVLVERGPTRTSHAGKILCDHARQVAELEQELIASQQNGTFLNADDEAPIFRIALTEEAINGWFRRVLDACLDPHSQTRIDVTTSNPDRAIDLMQSGAVVAAISTAKNPINGFKVFRLGQTPYVSVATPAFIESNFPDGITADALAKAPCLRYCHNDCLASIWAEHRSKHPPALPLHTFPDNKGTLKSVLAGQAWAMIEKSEADPYLQDQQLIELLPGSQISQALYWHVAVSMLEPMSDFTKAIREHAP